MTSHGQNTWKVSVVGAADSHVQLIYACAHCGTIISMCLAKTGLVYSFGTVNVQ